MCGSVMIIVNVMQTYIHTHTYTHTHTHTHTHSKIIGICMLIAFSIPSKKLNQDEITIKNLWGLQTNSLFVFFFLLSHYFFYNISLDSRHKKRSINK